SMNPQRRREIVTLVVVFTGVLLVSALAVYLIGNRGTTPEYTQVQEPGRTDREPLSRPTVAPSPNENETFLDRLMGTRYSEVYGRGERWAQTMGRIALRLLLATLLGAGLAYRPRRRVLAIKRNPYVSQTQILLAIVAAALMMAIFSFIVLWILEWREPEQVFRAMDLKVTTKNVVSTQRALREIFRKHGFDKELRAVDREASEEAPGNIVYSVDVSPTVSTDELSADILALDGQNVEGIEWDPKKS